MDFNGLSMTNIPPLTTYVDIFVEENNNWVFDQKVLFAYSSIKDLFETIREYLAYDIKEKSYAEIRISIAGQIKLHRIQYLPKTREEFKLNGNIS